MRMQIASDRRLFQHTHPGLSHTEKAGAEGFPKPPTSATLGVWTSLTGMDLMDIHPLAHDCVLSRAAGWAKRGQGGRLAACIKKNYQSDSEQRAIHTCMLMLSSGVAGEQMPGRSA